MVRMIAIGMLLVAGSLGAPVWTSSTLHAQLKADSRDVDANRAVGAQIDARPIAHFRFDGTIDNTASTPAMEVVTGSVAFTRGLEGMALSLGNSASTTSLSLGSEDLPFDVHRDLSVQFWVRTVAGADQRYVVLSTKDVVDNSLATQKRAGWVFYVSDGTWAWNMGSDGRRITYERENGKHMPVNDGRWHQLTMTYESATSLVRLFYDGDNKVTYNVADAEGFDFGTSGPLLVGWPETEKTTPPEVLPAIETGAIKLQELVDTFNAFGLAELESEELVHLVVDPRRLFDRKVAEEMERLGADSLVFRAAMDSVDWEPISALERELMANPYTVHQVLNFMQVAPLIQIYALVDGRVTVRPNAATRYAERERLIAPAFDVDELAIWDRVLSPEEVQASYSQHYVPAVAGRPEELTSLVAACWNIWHGGKHFTMREHGWDSRVSIAEILKREQVDVVMMQETYSSGDFIAAELGFYFATTVDWDYLNQGSNISVLSRYPIKEIHVQGESPFMNVAAKVAISATQDLYVMSNWYGMQQFPAVFEFHQQRFLASDRIPILFAGDFNAVPHADGGDSPASVAMLDAGFIDAFRSLSPDVSAYPGFTHRSGRRIDQLYYKGAGLENTSTRVLSAWPPGFPSDHYLILSTFDLDYVTAERE
jgi:exonuclease III